jgi:hypothetical protein
MNEKGRDSTRKANPDILYKEVIAKCGDKWKNDMSASQKKPYETRAAENKVAYDKEIEKYKNNS